MEKNNSLQQNEFPKFRSPEEEILYLRERIKSKEKALLQRYENVDRESVIRSEVRQYAKSHPDEVLHKGYKMMEPVVREIALDLSPETHDSKMEELLAILEQKGVRNAMNVVKFMDNPHLDDDFHRFLVQYLKSGMHAEDAKSKDQFEYNLRSTLFEVAMPQSEESEKRPLKELISSMEQLYAGLLHQGADYSVAFEIANPEGAAEAIFYVAVPDKSRDIFEKQVLSIFPKAKIFEKKDDYNVFNYDGGSVIAEVSLTANPIFPIKTYDTFDYDPLNVLLNAFSKIERDGEGAAIQFVLTPDRSGYLGRYKDALRSIEKGEKVSRAIDIGHTVLSDLGKGVKYFFSDEMQDIFSGEGSGNKNEIKHETNQMAIEQIKNKISTPIVHTNIRVVASARSIERAGDILETVEAAFHQYENTLGNSLGFRKFQDKAAEEEMHKFAYRQFDQKTSLPMSVREITSIAHFPVEDTVTPHLKIARASTAPAPVDMPKEGIQIGVNRDRNTHTDIFMTADDRLRHVYSIGQTGTGKTTFLKNMIYQDILNGDGVCMIDPHGNDIQDVLGKIPPERFEDVIYFDPGFTSRPMALNMLEYDTRYPEQKTFVVNEMLSIFNKLFDMKVAGGPMFEQYFRNAVLLVMEDPESGNTLLDVSKVLASRQFREMKLGRCRNPVVVQFWNEIASKAGGEASLANIVPYITSKFDVFLSNDIMRPIIAQEKSSFNFREIMDSKKILLINLAKGRLGDINSSLIGLILVGKILMAALSRADSFGRELPPFYLYIDEFQNITTDSITQILSEARKYKLSLTIAHQFIGQLEDDIKDAVFGNAGSIISFRVGPEDAEFLEKQFAPVFTAKDLINLDNRNAYVKMLSNGKPARPFSIETIVKGQSDPEKASELKQLSYLTYGRDRDEIENEISERYRKKEEVKTIEHGPLATTGNEK